MAANDGASGVAVMIEVARQLSLMEKEQNGAKRLPADIGIDFVCFDAEAWGLPQWETNMEEVGDTWALGALHFSTNLPAGFSPEFAVLLDMVGGEGAQFYREGMSVQYAPDVVNRVWNAAREAGFGSYFPNDGRPYSAQREGRYPHCRCHSLLSRLPAEQFRTDVAHHP